MSVYRDALQITAESPVDRLALARALLQSGEGVVVLDDRLALRSSQGSVLCEVIDRSIGLPKRGPSEYESLVKAGRQLLQDSPLWEDVRGRELRWFVIHDYGNGAVQLWPAA